MLLIHLGAIGALASGAALCAGAGSAGGGGGACVCAAILLALHPLQLWTVCGLHADKAAAIAAPLHYSAIVSPRKVIIFYSILYLLCWAQGTQWETSLSHLAKDSHLYLYLFYIHRFVSVVVVAINFVDFNFLFCC